MKYSTLVIFSLFLSILSVVSCSNPNLINQYNRKYIPPYRPAYNEDNNSELIHPPKSKVKFDKEIASSYEIDGHRYYTFKNCLGFEEAGTASWYGGTFHGRTTANGETYNMYGMTAAHRSLPFECYVLVTNLNNGRQVVVKINDRGPFYNNRVIDLSYTAALKLDLVNPGTGPVEVRAITLETVDKKKPASKNFYIQVGSFQNRSAATELQKKVQTTIQFPVEINSALQQQALLHQVRIGPISDEKIFHNLIQELPSMGFSDYVIIQ
ncbi:septal ring lytic transglycosylase RlpA family protein [Candidatus Nitrosacidococcus sp. I8]|uniref:septal ring lytic transglycosylase RlpA family protein n=1 Tax=Candidatus Nitrosacidococcus sp. I8 TaxID=2942908 RepID=UPI002226980F|nr:septal ring lytic transglycosylase RlpA family protein [Candidatus Nitrosacidococcus sp. I8]CAH9019424.1 Endolytic peptidoglycan transglycosylase RlpA [Candidatus Nitrosacidococcus sp. I8]